ncbi:MAG: type II secretion system protein GspM [Oceanicaulis sp.]
MRDFVQGYIKGLTAAGSPWLERARAQWRGRSGREQGLIALMAACLAAAALHLLVLTPTLQARAGLRADIGRLDAALAVARGAAPVEARGAPDSRPAAVRLNLLAAEHGLAIARLEDDGVSQTLVLEDAPFDAVALWVAAVESTPDLSVTQLSLERRPTPGLVATRAEIEGG